MGVYILYKQGNRTHLGGVAWKLFENCHEVSDLFLTNVPEIYKT